ncbi:MAG: beta-ketoacyl synthase chain length factor [Cognaticolwellia aestuarii]
MEFSLSIDSAFALFPASQAELTNPALKSVLNQYGYRAFDKSQLPTLDWLTAMQRRRLSRFAKLSLHAAFQASQLASVTDVPLSMVFSSRHGDLHKTNGLLNDIAGQNGLSPTAFSLSVHNAAAGLYSIFTDNTQQHNAISAGKDSIFMALADAYTRLKTTDCQQVLVVHTDQVLPDDYLRFADEDQVDHAVAFVVSLAGNSDVNTVNKLSLSATPSEIDSQKTPSALALYQWWQQGAQILELVTENRLWRLSKNDQ